MACAVASVSCQGFYAWQRRCLAPPCATDLAEAELVGEVRRTSGDFGSTYGLPLGVTDRGACSAGPVCEPQAPRVHHGPALASHGAGAVRDAIAMSIVALPQQLRRSLT